MCVPAQFEFVLKGRGFSPAVMPQNESRLLAAAMCGQPGSDIRRAKFAGAHGSSPYTFISVCVPT
jgi:hypothetical protein